MSDWDRLVELAKSAEDFTKAMTVIGVACLFLFKQVRCGIAAIFKFLYASIMMPNTIEKIQKELVTHKKEAKASARKTRTMLRIQDNLRNDMKEELMRKLTSLEIRVIQTERRRADG